MDDSSSLIALNSSLSVTWGASLVPTWRTILSGLFLKCGIIKNFNGCTRECSNFYALSF